MTQVQLLSDEEFYDRFQPEEDEWEGWPVQRDYPDDTDVLDQAVAENRIWTALDCGDIPVIASGRREVNCLYHVITKVAWDRDYEVKNN